MKKMSYLSAIVSVILLASLGIALASPAQQGGSLLPTPTPYPVEELEYELTIVGGKEEVIVGEGVSQNGITIGEHTAVSQYPRGIIFRTTIETENDVAIESATVFLRYDANSGTRVSAELDPTTGEWVAHIWESGNGRPPWTHFRYFWRVVDANGNTAETEPIAMYYSDPTREWYRVETPHVVLYWFGTTEVEPETVAQWVAEAVASTEPRRIAGFGQPLSYKPHGVLFPDDVSLAEMYGSGTTNDNAAGFTSSDLGMTVQEFGMPSDAWFERQAECIYLRPREERTEEVRLRGAVFSTIPHEIAHLYQYENGGAIGPQWWSEGQADYFTHSAGRYDFRLSELAKLDPNLPPLSIETSIGAQAFQADGCYALAYDVGASFINWLLTNYGGIDTHRQIVENYTSGMTVYEAIEAATGKSFFDLENEWRAYLGFNQLTLADVDPAAALEEAPNAKYQPNDTVVLPGPRPVILKDAPGGVIGNAQCFAGTSVTILRVGTLEGIDWYEVDCLGLVGWLTLDELE
ncbi:MAG: hypothetical protein CUN55_09020 [Phototrophicales bacterium]|nr:MAG: hypothetical protein CUN55_09020 [Phototrophicales bacterium]